MKRAEGLTGTTYAVLHRRSRRLRWLRLQRLRLRQPWRALRPFVVIVLAVAVLVLGTIGFQEVKPSDEPFDSFYRALALFGLGGAIDEHVPTTLQIARILGPIVTGYAAVRGLLALSREQVQLLWFRLALRRHVVVAGLGDFGFRLARSFNDAGFGVVAIERNPAEPAIAGCRERGISVLTGDATDAATLRAVRCDRADLFVTTLGDDGLNMNAAAAATGVARARRTGVLTALVHVDDVALRRTLQAEELASTRTAPVRLEFFNVFESAARILLDRFPPLPADQSHEGRHGVVVVGFDGVAPSLVIELAARWRRSSRAPGAELRVMLVGPTADEDAARLLARLPELGSICALEARRADLEVDVERGDLDLSSGGAWPVRGVYVCVRDEAHGMAAAMALSTDHETAEAPIVVTVADAGAGVASSVRDGAGILEDIDAFGVMSAALQPELVLRGNTELLARAKHEEYVEHQLAAGVPPGPPAMVPWSELPEDYKDDNRRFADGIGAKLIEARCALVARPLGGRDGDEFAFTDDEVEALARAEHDRWMRDKARAGWRYGPERDEARRLHPSMRPWPELSEEEREKDRNPMRELPRIVARTGLEIQRAPARRAVPPRVSEAA